MIVFPEFLIRLKCLFIGYRVVDVACGSGDAQTLCITDEDGGTVWSWGDGDYGKLGRGWCKFIHFVIVEKSIRFACFVAVQSSS